MSGGLEEQLTEMSNGLYQAILDLNNGSAKVNGLMTQLVSVRNKLLVHYGVEANPQALSGGGGGGGEAVSNGSKKEQTGGGKGKGGGKGGQKKKGGGGGAPPPTAKKQKVAAIPTCGAGEKLVADFKSKLVQCVAQRAKKTPSKDMLIVNCEECQVEVQGVVGTGYVATVESSDLTANYQGEAAKAKKEAVQNACKVALNKEFPGEKPASVKVADTDAAAPAAKGAGVKAPAAKGAGVKAPKGATQPGGGNANESENLKGKVSRSLALMLGRSCIGTDMVYTTEQAADGTHECILTMPEYGPEGYQGNPGGDKKAAEQNAAATMLHALADVISAAEAQQAVKKEQQRAERAAAGLPPR